MTTPVSPLPCTHNLLITVAAGTLTHFTSLLQGGIFLEARQGITLGDLLDSLPGFDHTYVSERVQTIFIDGLPADDLAQPLTGTNIVVAISAAMPGLAGAIFRKNGVHASLRTTKNTDHTQSPGAEIPLTARLKLFNMIAKERGADILSSGCSLSGSSLGKFFSYRLPLLAHIQTYTLNGETTDIERLRLLLHDTAHIHLNMQEMV